MFFRCATSCTTTAAAQRPLLVYWSSLNFTGPLRCTQSRSTRTSTDSTTICRSLKHLISLFLKYIWIECILTWPLIFVVHFIWIFTVVVFLQIFLFACVEIYLFCSRLCRYFLISLFKFLLTTFMFFCFFAKCFFGKKKRITSSRYVPHKWAKEWMLMTVYL